MIVRQRPVIFCKEKQWLIPLFSIVYKKCLLHSKKTLPIFILFGCGSAPCGTVNEILGDLGEVGEADLGIGAGWAVLAGTYFCRLRRFSGSIGSSWR